VARPMAPQAVLSLCVVALSLACSRSRAAPPSEGAPANAAPAGTRPATAPVADEYDVGPALAEFLKAVDAKDDKAAYALATAAFRKAHSLEDFTKQMDRVRTDVDLASRQFQLSVARPPKGDRPREAIAYIVAVPARTNRQSVGVVVAFADEGGRWRVADVELRDGGKLDGLRGAFFRANRGPHDMGMAGLSSVSLHARVTKLEEKSVTVEPVPMDKQAPPRPPRTFEIDGQTKVFVIVLQENFKLPSGQTVPYERPVPARLADLKVADKVTVEMPPGQERALKITIRDRKIEPAPGL
jgi:hypothetical protein